MNKKGGWIFWISVIAVVILIIMAFLYFAGFKPGNERVYDISKIKNPSENLTLREAIAQFDESFVFYVLYQIKAYNLHNPPLSYNTPKIEFRIDDEVYNAEIVKGMINVKMGAIENKDAVITTTKEEAVRMTMDKNYIQESFNSGKSNIELVASKTVLFAKGYLNLYTEITGKSITGNVIRIYAS